MNFDPDMIPIPDFYKFINTIPESEILNVVVINDTSLKDHLKLYRATVKYINEAIKNGNLIFAKYIDAANKIFLIKTPNSSNFGMLVII